MFIPDSRVHEVFLSDDRYLGLLHKSFLNQTTLDLRKEMLTFLNQEFAYLGKLGLTQ